jgi:hypothetical protein
MSSFPRHKENIRQLEMMGFDVSEALENNEVTLESWGYDEQTYLLYEIIQELKKHNFKVKAT